MWFFKEVGAYLVFIANQVPEHIKSDDLIVDLTGLHSVIIQGVHIITHEGDQLYNHSKWLNHAFGGANQITDKLQNL